MEINVPPKKLKPKKFTSWRMLFGANAYPTFPLPPKIRSLAKELAITLKFFGIKPAAFDVKLFKCLND